jgi:ribosome-associated protein
LRSSLPEAVKTRLLNWADQRITAEGVVVIKAQDSRSLERNRADAIARLVELVQAAAHVPKARKATKPTYGSQQRRLEGKAKRSGVKAARRSKPDF